MTVRTIRIMGDPVLRRPAESVAELDDEVRALVEDMFDTMYTADGVGLAAPQVGVGQRVIVVDVREPEHPPFALVNPHIVEAAAEMARDEEGCLSIPGLRDFVERPARVVVEGLEADGGFRRVEADGLLARVLQHEIDHLDGALFLDRLSPLKRQLLLRSWQKAGT